jgi:hypothetical protein
MDYTAGALPERKSPGRQPQCARLIADRAVPPPDSWSMASNMQSDGERSDEG